jgi:biopolymer transport protein ExbB/TolQ
MNLLSAMENGLFALGQVLRFPVMALLWFCIACALFMAGSCLADWVVRRRERRGFDIDLWLRKGAVLCSDEARKKSLPASLQRLLAEMEQGLVDETLADGGLEHLVLESEERVRRTLNGPRMLVKVGPALGLLGTLIPMGTSLASLAAGNLEAMSGQMVVAFTTTIIGLATGTLAYVVAAIRLGWVNETVREQRFLAERVAGELARTDVFAHKV